MQAVVVQGPADYRLEQVPIPTPKPGELLVKVEAVEIVAAGDGSAGARRR